MLINSTTNTKNSKKQETNNLFVARNTKAMEKLHRFFYIGCQRKLRRNGRFGFISREDAKERKVLVTEPIDFLIHNVQCIIMSGVDSQCQKNF